MGPTVHHQLNLPKKNDSELDGTSLGSDFGRFSVGMGLGCVDVFQGALNWQAVLGCGEAPCSIGCRRGKPVVG